MFEYGLNQKTVTVKMTRHELCNVIIALQIIKDNSGTDNPEFYANIINKLNEQRQAFDEKYLRGDKQ